MNNKKRSSLAVLAFVLINLSVISSYEAAAQVGGQNSFQFLHVPENARLAALGGINVSLRDQDPNLIFFNPAALNDSMQQRAAINYTPYFANTSQTTLAYVLPVARRSLGLSMKYFDYGTSDQYDAAGNQQGSFRSSDFALQGTYAVQSGDFIVGITPKLIGSYLETYSAYAFAVDMGAIYQHPEKELTVGLAVKNIGGTLKSYTDEDRLNLPIDVQLGGSYKLEHVPLRFSLTAHHLQQFDIVYQDPALATRLDASGQPVSEDKTFSDKLLRHFVAGAELVLSDGFQLRAGYNFLRGRELSLQEVTGGAGFSLGAMLRVRSFDIGYTYGFYHAAGGSSFLSLGIDIDRLRGKRKITIKQQPPEKESVGEDN